MPKWINSKELDALEALPKGYMVSLLARDDSDPGT